VKVHRKGAGSLEVSDADLIQQCLQGDNAGFDLLVKKYQRQVYTFCRGMLGNGEDSSDAAQETFVKAYYALDTFRRDAQFLTWLIRIANNACVDLWRRKSRHQSLSLSDESAELMGIPSDEPAPEHVVLGDERARLVNDAVERLPEKYRGAVVMFHFNAMSIREISEALRRPEGTVKSDLHTAREMLRRKLEGVVVEA
jgi:RNA polymerase sigma-70 factor (ECF subfamily)